MARTACWCRPAWSRSTPPQRPGLKALIVAAGLVQGKISAGDISFMLGPRLNAAGRIDDALLSYKLLLADDFAGGAQLADDAQPGQPAPPGADQRDPRPGRAGKFSDLGKQANRIVVLDGEGYPAGLVGLVAAKLVEELARPVLLLERGAETSRGSARSVPGFNIIEALTACDDLFVRYGGHSAAAGFTIANERLPELEARLLALRRDAPARRHARRRRSRSTPRCRWAR